MAFLPRYEYEDNLVLHFLGGGDVLFDMIACISRLWPWCWFPFRGDSLACIAELLQTETITMLKKASLACKHRLKYQDVYPPEVNADDIQLVNSIAEVDYTRHKQYYGVSDHTWHQLDYFKGYFIKPSISRGRENPFITREARERLARMLGFRSGISKMNDDVFPLVWAKMMEFLTVLLQGLHEGLGNVILDQQNILNDMSAEEFEERKAVFKGGDLRMWYSPTFDNNELHNELNNNSIVPVSYIVPGHVKKAAAWAGMKPIMGYQQLGCDGWATTKGRTKEEEINETIDRYNRSPLFNDEHVGSMSDDGDFEECSDNEESDDSDNELDDSFFETDEIVRIRETFAA